MVSGKDYDKKELNTLIVKCRENKEDKSKSKFSLFQAKKQLKKSMGQMTAIAINKKPVAKKESDHLDVERSPSTSKLNKHRQKSSLRSDIINIDQQDLQKN